MLSAGCGPDGAAPPSSGAPIPLPFPPSAMAARETRTDSTPAPTRAAALPAASCRPQPDLGRATSKRQLRRGDERHLGPLPPRQQPCVDQHGREALNYQSSARKEDYQPAPGCARKIPPISRHPEETKRTGMKIPYPTASTCPRGPRDVDAPSTCPQPRSNDSGQQAPVDVPGPTGRRYYHQEHQHHRPAQHDLAGRVLPFTIIVASRSLAAKERHQS